MKCKQQRLDSFLHTRTKTLDELEKILRRDWQKGTTEQFLELIHQHSDYDRREAAEFLIGLIDDGKMAYNSEDLLVWVKGGTKFRKGDV